jgi:protein phosphatase
MFDMEYYAISDIGKSRSSNEDCFHSEDNLFIVADGMGGHNAGEVASKNAVIYFVECFKNLLNENKPDGIIEKPETTNTNKLAKRISKNTSLDKIQKIMIESIEFANSKIYQMGLENEEFSGMGTTFTCLFTKDKKGYVIHIGDSRLYIYRDCNLNLLTEDHTFVFSLYKSGAITYEEMFDHPQRNYLTGVIGESEISTLECFKFDLAKDDIILLCSDGLSSMIDDYSIKAVMDKFKDKSPKNIAEILVKKANKNGGKDNITVIILKESG